MRRLKFESTTISHIKELRRKGYSIGEIKSLTGGSRSTILRYVKNVKISENYIAKWTSKRGGSKKRMLELEEKAFVEAKEQIKNLSSQEKLLFLAALYWAEGNKKDFILTNSDPLLIKVFIDMARDILDVRDENIQISIRIFQNLDENKCLNFWSSITEIPKEKFISINVIQGKKEGKLEYGMCRLRVKKGGHLLKKIKAINRAVVSHFIK